MGDGWVGTSAADGVPIISTRSCTWKKSFAGDSILSEMLRHLMTDFSACRPCFCQAAHPQPLHAVFFPPQRIVKWRPLPAGSCCFELSGDKTDQQGGCWHVTDSGCDDTFMYSEDTTNSKSQILCLCLLGLGSDSSFHLGSRLVFPVIVGLFG